MRKYMCLFSALALCVGSANAVVIVNGVPGEDADNTSPFETLQAAVSHAVTAAETVIEIHTNDGVGGVYLEHVDLPQDLIIRAGAGFSPLVNDALHFIPSNAGSSVYLQDLTVSTPGTTTPLSVGCTLTAFNCVFNGNPMGGGFYFPAITAATPSVESDSVLTLTSCTVIGFTGIEAGRACREYIIDKCFIESRPTDISTQFSVGISNAMNWQTGFAARLGVDQGFTEITEPRTVQITNSFVRAGTPIGWPNNTLGNDFYTNEHSTIGPIIATNSVFEPYPANGIGYPIQIDNSVLPETQNPGSTFTHCTFRSIQAFGLFWFPGGGPATHTFNNCLFDAPLVNYAIAVHPGMTLAGDANTYNIFPTYELEPGDIPPFEATEHNYMIADFVDPLLTDEAGNLLGPNPHVVAKALPVDPPVLTDKDGNPRPMPIVAARSDIGADEIDETATSDVNGWSLY